MIHMIHTRKIVGHIFGTNVGITTLAWSTEVASLSRLGANVAKTCDTGLQDVPLTHQKEKIRKTDATTTYTRLRFTVLASTSNRAT